MSKERAQQLEGELEKLRSSQREGFEHVKVDCGGASFDDGKNDGRERYRHYKMKTEKMDTYENDQPKRVESEIYDQVPSYRKRYETNNQKLVEQADKPFDSFSQIYRNQTRGGGTSHQHHQSMGPTIEESRRSRSRSNIREQRSGQHEDSPVWRSKREVFERPSPHQDMVYRLDPTTVLSWEGKDRQRVQEERQKFREERERLREAWNKEAVERELSKDGWRKSDRKRDFEERSRRLDRDSLSPSRDRDDYSQNPDRTERIDRYKRPMAEPNWHREEYYPNSSPYQPHRNEQSNSPQRVARESVPREGVEGYRTGNDSLPSTNVYSSEAALAQIKRSARNNLDLSPTKQKEREALVKYISMAKQSSDNPQKLHGKNNEISQTDVQGDKEKSTRRYRDFSLDKLSLGDKLPSGREEDGPINQLTKNKIRSVAEIEEGSGRFRKTTLKKKKKKSVRESSNDESSRKKKRRLKTSVDKSTQVPRRGGIHMEKCCVPYFELRRTSLPQHSHQNVSKVVPPPIIPIVEKRNKVLLREPKQKPKDQTKKLQTKEIDKDALNTLAKIVAKKLKIKAIEDK